jgi:hypothetical protein
MLGALIVVSLVLFVSLLVNWFLLGSLNKDVKKQVAAQRKAEGIWAMCGYEGALHLARTEAEAREDKMYWYYVMASLVELEVEKRKEEAA